MSFHCKPRLRLAVPLFAGLAAALSIGPAVAAPPYTTDDPEPTDTGHWEDYAFVSGTNLPGETIGQSGIELDHGAAEDLQLTVILPLDYVKRGHYRFGTGDAVLAAKYRFVHTSEEDWFPDIAVFPAVAVPTAARAFGTGHATVQLPVWLEKDFGKWSTFGGGYYDINPGAGNRDYAFAGWAVTRPVTERFSLGTEAYRQTSPTVGGHALTAVVLGASYQLSEHWALVGSGGPYLQRARGPGRSTFYAALKLTY